jgi:two-component system NtrC family response regulator
MASGRCIEPADLELAPVAGGPPETLKDIRERAEAEAVRQALIRSEGLVNKAAEQLGISRPTLYHLMKKFGLED